MTVYQFQLGREPAGPFRFTWREAANDLAFAGYGTWTPTGVRTEGQARIAQFHSHAALSAAPCDELKWKDIRDGR